LIQVQATTATGAAFLPLIMIMFLLAWSVVNRYGAKLPLMVGHRCD